MNKQLTALALVVFISNVQATQPSSTAVALARVVQVGLTVLPAYHVATWVFTKANNKPIAQIRAEDKAFVDKKIAKQVEGKKNR